jgi:hypothetical protein
MLVMCYSYASVKFMVFLVEFYFYFLPLHRVLGMPRGKVVRE